MKTENIKIEHPKNKKTAHLMSGYIAINLF